MLDLALSRGRELKGVIRGKDQLLMKKDELLKKAHVGKCDGNDRELEELRAQLAELRTMIKAKLDKEFQTEYLVLVVAVVPTVAAACITTVAESGFSSLDYDTRARVQSMCAGTFDEKTDTEGWTFLNDVADKTYQWQTMREEIPSHRANVHQVDSNSESATLRTILEKIENLETGKRERHPNTSSVNHVVMPNCVVCESSDHLVQDCPDVLSLREGRKDQANAMYQRPNNQPFNGGWNNNSNNSNSRGNRNYQGGSSGSAPYQPHNQVNQHQSSSSWQQNPSYQAPLNVPYVPPHNRNLPPPTTSLEDTLKAFMQVTQSSIAKLEGQIGQMATEISTRDKGTFPSQTQANPKGNTEHPRSSNRDGVNAIISLRSGTKVDNLVKMPKEPELEIQSKETFVINPFLKPNSYRLKSC
ncbi:hypothetical protein GIB67_035865 [Kingdonia uniflora]|uniref:Uncharacterized protein n=1 Tax=Kingdonia uniflora TaxID=39325 RepID=A0A7J7L820_9MAGN|nr:hypothetical protein GIB67_035865 [Kingdonia uniflora]